MSLSGNVGNRNGGKTSEQGIIQALSVLAGYTGVFGSTALAVSAQGSPNKTVAIAVGDCLIGSLSPSASIYSYHGWLPTTGNITIANNTSGSARIDTIVAYIDLSVVSSSSNDNPGAFKVDVVAGTPAGSPVHPSDGAIETAIGASNPFIRLADIAVANSFTSIVSGNITDVRFSLLGGWHPVSDAWAYASADSPTFVITVPNNALASYQPGTRIRLTQSSTVKYFIVTAVTATTLTVYGGTDYTLANSAISNIYYSNEKAPIGFPLDPTKWSVLVTDDTERSQTSPAANTWYNIGSMSITIPIGCWNMLWEARPYCSYPTASRITFGTTLSTANNTESDFRWTAKIAAYSNNTGTSVSLTRRGRLTLAAKTVYYLNTLVNDTGAGTLFNENNDTKLVIEAVCAYL